MRKILKMKNIKGIIFDLDGTLIDSMGVWHKVDIEFLTENGIEPPADISDKVRKMTIDGSSQYFIDRFGLSCTKEYVIKRIEELVRIEYERNIPLKPHAKELLSCLDDAGCPYGVATATYKSLASAVLERCGILDRLRFLLTDVEYPLGKRFPDIYLGGAELLGTAPDETLVAEDSLHCVETAVSAGFTVVGVYDESSSGDAERIKRISHFYVRSLEELEELLKGNLI